MTVRPNRLISASSEQSIGEIHGLLQGLASNVSEFRDQVKRQEARSNDERNSIVSSIAVIRDKQTDSTARVEMRLDELAKQVKDVADTRVIVTSMRDKVDAIQSTVDKMAPRSEKLWGLYQKIVIYGGVFTSAMTIIWLLASESIKGALLHFLSNPPPPGPPH